MEKVFAGVEKDDFPERKPSTSGKLPEVIAYNNALPVNVQDANDPQVSERASKLDHMDEDEEEKKRVKFNKPGEENKPSKDENEDHRRRKTRSQHYKQRKHSLGDGQGNKKAGTAESGGRRISVQPEDAELQVRDSVTIFIRPFQWLSTLRIFMNLGLRTLTSNISELGFTGS